MLNAEGLINAALFLSKTSKDQFISLEEGRREWDIDIQFGSMVDRAGRDFYYELATKTPGNLNVTEEKVDFLESGEVRITDGIFIRSVRVAYTEVENGELVYYLASPRSTDDYTTVPFKGSQYAPEYDLVDTFLKITPQPDRTVQDGVILRYIEPFRRLTIVTKEYPVGSTTVEKDVPNLDEEVWGIPQEYREVLIPGIAMYILKAKGDMQGSREMEISFERKKHTAIKQLKQRLGRVARRSYTGGRRNTLNFN